MPVREKSQGPLGADRADSPGTRVYITVSLSRLNRSTPVDGRKGWRSRAWI